MLHRRLQELVSHRLADVPCVVLLGPRQVGKTTLARAIAADFGGGAVYLDLERPADRSRLADADAYLRAQAGKLVVIDEIHRLPGLFEVLRGIIDDRRATGDRTGHFLLLGSASLDLMRQSSESLAGRASYIELAAFDALDWVSADRAIDSLWVRGGFPDSALAQDDARSMQWRRDFIRSYLERDVPMFAPRLPAAGVGRLWGMLAYAQGSLLNASGFAGSMGISSPTVARYLELLVDLQLVRRLSPWHANVGKRFVRSPKTYLRDSGLLHALLDIPTWDTLLGHPIVGFSWEGFVIENLIAAAGDHRHPHFFRTADGAEIDLLFERGGRVEFAIEIKRSTAPKVSHGFHSACDTLQPQAAFVVHGGDGAWSMGDGITATDLLAMMQRLQQDD